MGEFAKTGSRIAMEAHLPTNPGPIAHLTPCGGGQCASVCAECRVRLYAVCAALDEGEVHALERITQHMSLPAKSALFHAGDAANSVYTVTSGTLRLQRDLADGRRQIIGFAIPGDFIGLAMDQHFGFSADSLTPVNLCRFDRQAFSRLASEKQGLMGRLHNFASHELGLAQEHMVVLGRRRADERVAAFLLRWRERMARLTGASATLALPMGRQDIADYLGLTIETVSRTLARWMREKVILDVPDGIRILDPARLEQVLSG